MADIERRDTSGNASIQAIKPQEKALEELVFVSTPPQKDGPDPGSTYTYDDSVGTGQHIYFVEHGVLNHPVGASCPKSLPILLIRFEGIE
jgi:hypothetical protein